MFSARRFEKEEILDYIVEREKARLMPKVNRRLLNNQINFYQLVLSSKLEKPRNYAKDFLAI